MVLMLRGDFLEEEVCEEVGFLLRSAGAVADVPAADAWDAELGAQPLGELLAEVVKPAAEEGRDGRVALAPARAHRVVHVLQHGVPLVSNPNQDLPTVRPQGGKKKAVL